MLLTDHEKKQLLKLARGTLEYYFTHKKQPRPDETGIVVTEAMKEPCGVFVTLKKHGDLRGCIGHILAQMPLVDAVVENAMSAAFRDPRFGALDARELPQVHIEISVLTPPDKVARFRDIVIGTHGILLSKQGRRAVFLPQVASEQGWNLEQTLTHLAMKAGLPPDAWREDAAFEVFEAIVFGEPEE